jgi:hypothetical protein
MPENVEKPGKTLLTGHLKGLPEIWSEGPLSTGARGKAREIKQLLTDGKPIPPKWVDWVRIYAKQCKSKEWLNIDFNGIKVEMGKEGEMNEAINGEMVGKLPQSIEQWNHHATMERDGNIGSIIGKVAAEVAMRFQGTMEYFMGAMERVYSTAISKIEEAHKQSTGALSANNAALANLNTNLINSIPAIHANFNNLSKQYSDELKRMIREAREEKIAPEERDSFDKALDAIQAATPMAAPIIVGVLEKYGVTVPAEFKKAIAGMMGPAEEEKK